MNLVNPTFRGWKVFAQFPNTFLINAPPHLPPSIPFSGFCLPHLCRNLISIAGMACDSRGRFCKEEAPQPRPRPSSSVLSAAPAKRLRFHGDGEELSQHATSVRLPRRSIEEASSSLAQGRKPYMHTRAKLADSSDVRHGQTLFFPRREGRSGPRALR
jgi:hypothetical protein